VARATLKHTIGTGSGNSFIIGAVPVRPLATTLQRPIAVALFSIGKILSSVKLAKYELKNPISIPNLAMKTQIGILEESYNCLSKISA